MYVIITHTYVSFVINNNIEFVLLSFLVCANLLLYGLCERSTFHMKKLLKNTIAAVAVILGIGLGLGIGQKNYVQAAQDTYSLSMAEDNKWYYYKNGVVDTGYTGLAYNDYGWFYVKDGSIDWGYTGLAYNENGWFYVNGGILDWSYTGLAYNAYGTWYIVNGTVAFDYTGSVNNVNVVNGQVVGHEHNWVHREDIYGEKFVSKDNMKRYDDGTYIIDDGYEAVYESHIICGNCKIDFIQAVRTISLKKFLSERNVQQL